MAKTVRSVRDNQDDLSIESLIKGIRKASKRKMRDVCDCPLFEDETLTEDELEDD